MAARNTAQDAVPDWDAELQVYEPHRAGLPAFGPYFRALWGRRAFAAEFSRAGIKAAHSRTAFGQIWLILNPLLLALVYFFVVSVFQKSDDPVGRLVHIVCGIFIFYFFSGSVATGAGSVTGGGQLIMNMAFPRLLMPIAMVRTAFVRFLPTVPVLILFMLFGDAHWSFSMLLALVFLVLLTMFGAGMATFMATLQVYFRDTSSFLPYFLRIWLYVSPILFTTEQLEAAVPRRFLLFNPLFSLIGGWNQVLQEGIVPAWDMWLAAAVWAVIALVGGSLFFMSRERDFVVRL